jgi:hypothetical protein
MSKSNVERSFGRLLHRWDGNPVSVQGWFCSRKYNGHSVIWDGGVTRGVPLDQLDFYIGKKNSGKAIGDHSGKATGLWTLGRARRYETQPNPTPIMATESFLNSLPVGIPLHGELWCDDDKSFIERFTTRLVPVQSAWDKIMFMVFAVKPWSTFPAKIQVLAGQELAGQTTKILADNMDSSTQVHLLNKLKALLSLPSSGERKDGVVHVPEMRRILGPQIVNEMLEKSKNLNWEGLVFLSPYAKYDNTRRRDCLKYKPVTETEVEVLNWEMGKDGKNANRLCSLKVSLTWDDAILSIHGGTEAMVGKTVEFILSKLTEKDIVNIKTVYPVGSIVTIKFDYVTKYGVPSGAAVYKC